MARTVQDARLAKREQRLRLEARSKPYWMTLNEGEHLGYYRGNRVGKWLARFRRAGSTGNYQQVTIGEADDTIDADGAVILNFKQAQDRARDWFVGLERNGGRRASTYTVSDALDDYLLGFRGRDLANTRRRIEAIIRPQMGTHEVAKLTTKAISDWLAALASSPARLRTAKGASQNIRVTADTDEARRRRRSSANRVLTILKAALNAAYRDGSVPADDAWRRVKPFAKADASKLRYLSDAESRRIVNATDISFRPLVQAALLTGARYAELAGLEARDFDRQSQTVWLRETKAGVARAVYLEGEGVLLFEQATAGKAANDLIFPRADGKRWGPSQQTRPLAAACLAAKLEPTGFHDLRRTYGARLALRGVPMAVIAEALGHADERITRRHYAHLSKSYVGETIRGAVAGLGIIEQSNIAAIA
ncbi:site-specific integrase [Sphingomonas sp. SUN039]|uniref:tyrosine-type recombinase/integrase n=1 Tax=Sphingomonas sp. SUN039 TaxID=2937787 RepID=UPI0021645E40|nr:site-specific integrase [Sphingomonas sp. SUN039]UVO53808.1 site-specific integrase [Sphingomonas sp. SUN039]